MAVFDGDAIFATNTTADCTINVTRFDKDAIGGTFSGTTAQTLGASKSAPSVKSGSFLVARH